MARTESISFQVHPNDEQEQIDLMQQFHWSLLNTQDVKTIDNHLERRGDEIYQITNTEHYVKLTFSRPIDEPHLNEIKRLEQSFFGLPTPRYPQLFPASIWLWIIAAFFYGIGIVGWIAYYFLHYAPKKKEADQQVQENQKKRQQILTELGQYN